MTGHRDDIDAFFRVLARRERRTLLSALGEQDGAVRVSTLAETLAARRREAGCDVDAAAVEVRLRHSDLPALADAGLVAFDAEDDLVDAGRGDVAVEEALAAVAEAVEGIET